MPSITSSSNPAAGKPEKVSVVDVPDAFKQAASIVEKKCRNLEKRKGRLDVYREEAAKGKKLVDDQKEAVSHYDKVVATLDLTRDFIRQFEKIAIDLSKEEKKKKKREAFERAQQELARMKELLTIQEVFNCVRSDAHREDFINGLKGAPQLSEADLQKLDAFFSQLSVERGNISFNDAVTNSATHYQRLLDGNNKEVAGSTYREVKDLIMRVVSAGYFDWKQQTEVKAPEPIKEPEVEAIRPEIHNQEPQMYRTLPEERPYVDAGFEYIEPPAPLPPMPQVPQSTAYFPVEVETDFNFIQESLIDHQPILPMMPPTSVQMGVGGPPQTNVPVSLASMDSAVMMVHSQVPAAHLAAYSYLSNNPAAAASLYGSAPLVSAPGSTMPIAEQIAESARTASPAPPPTTSVAPQADTQVNTSTNANTATTSSTWAEEPQDEMPPYQQEQNRTESNTWTNSNYRSGENDSNGRRGGFRGRGNNAPRGSSRGSGSSGGYNNYSRNENWGNFSRGDRQGNGGERQEKSYDRYQNNGGGERNGTDRGGYQQRGEGGDRERSNNYNQGNNSGRSQYSNGGSYQGNNQGSYGGNRSDRGGSSGERSNYAPRGAYRGGPSRGGPPRGGSSRGSGGGSYERNTSSSYQRE